MDKKIEITNKIYSLLRTLYSKEKFEIWDEKDLYIKNISEFTQKIEDGINVLKQFENYLLIKPFPNYFIENGISEKDYFKFQFENFFIRCSSIIDFKMHLINCTLKIGLPNSKCGYHSLKENKNIKGTDLSVKMSKLYNDFEKNIKIRNGIIHQGNFDSDLLDDISAFITPNLPSELFDEDFNKYSNEEKEKNIKIAISELNKIIEKLEFHFGQLLEELSPNINFQLSIFNIKK